MREERGGSWGETRTEGGMRGTYEGRRGGEERTGLLQSWPSSSTPEKLYEIIQLPGNVKSD